MSRKRALTVIGLARGAATARHLGVAWDGVREADCIVGHLAYDYRDGSPASNAIRLAVSHAMLGDVDGFVGCLERWVRIDERAAAVIADGPVVEVARRMADHLHWRMGAAELIVKSATALAKAS